MKRKIFALDAIELIQEFVRCPSVTFESNREVTSLMARRLDSLGFEVREFEYSDLNGTPKVGLEARRQGSRPTSTLSGVGYFCHNDVVSVEGWNCPHGGAFEAVIADDRMWGRGTCDMKGSAAVAMSAISRIAVADQTAPIYFFVTGDEECGMRGAEEIASTSDFYREMVERQGIGIVGEPTELQLVAAHKGGCHFTVKAKGVAAHSSTEEGDNANWKLLPYLNRLKEFDERLRSEPEFQDDRFSPAHMSMNVVVENTPSMSNITVGQALCHVFLRPVPTAPWRALIAEMEQAALDIGLEFDLMRPMPPVETKPDRDSVQSMLALLGQRDAECVCYATDACCFQDLQDVVILGPGSIEQAHRSDEFIELSQVQKGVYTYERLFRMFAVDPSLDG
ncbi:MAG: M20/M25/M40 family metallo-hydrolase [Pirellulaceae bacterium]